MAVMAGFCAARNGFAEGPSIDDPGGIERTRPIDTRTCVRAAQHDGRCDGLDNLDGLLSKAEWPPSKHLDVDG